MSRVLHRRLTGAPVLAAQASGITITLDDGRRIIDGSSGPAVSCIGHGHPRVLKAMQKQAERLDYVHTGLFTNEPAERLAEHLVAGSHGAFDRVLFVSSGSEAMEVALKIARQYFVESGECERTHVIARRQSYHGATLSALAAGGHVSRRSYYEPLLSASYSKVSPCFAYHYQRAGESQSDYVERLRAELEAEILRVGAERVMAFCAETVVGATSGCVAAVPGYFEAVRSVCDRYGVLLILDEVMSGMGRTGTMHAWEQEGVHPDIQAIAKGLGGGYQPLGGVLVSGKVIGAILRGSAALEHGQTYQCHPVACAAALEVQSVIEEESLLENVRHMGVLLQHRLTEAFGDHEFVGDIRGRGLFWALEFVEDKTRRTPFLPSLALSDRIRRHAMDARLATYPSSGTIDGRCGDHVILAPPFNVTASDIDEIVSRLSAAVDSMFRELRAQPQ